MTPNMETITIDGLEWSVPPIRFCPSCGSKSLEPRFEGWLEHTKKKLSALGECADCGCHFHVSLQG